MTDTESKIEPGDKFFVAYGSEKSCEVVALGLRGQRKLAELVKTLVKLEDSSNGDALDLFEHAEAALRLAIPDVTDDFLDTIDCEMAIEIATETLAKQSLSEDDRKKFG